MTTDHSETAPAPFDLCAGHPALDFVNSLDNRFSPTGSKDLLSDYGALLRFVEETGLLSSSQARALARAAGTASAARVLRSARELREAMAAVLYAEAEQRVPAAAAIEMLERHFHGAQSPGHLHRVDPGAGAGAALQWQWRPDQARRAEFPVWLIAHSASQLMLSDALARVRACEADSCRWLFLDTSKNHTRRWCKMKVCGNRAKARRFQERRTQ